MQSLDINYVKHDVNRIHRLLMLAYKFFEAGSDELIFVSAATQSLEDLERNIENQLRRGNL